MPFDWVRDKILNLKRADNEAVPRRLRDSLMSQESNEAGNGGAEDADDVYTQGDSHSLSEEFTEVLLVVSDDEPSTIAEELSEVVSDDERLSLAGPCGNQNYEIAANETVKWNDPEVFIREEKFAEFDSPDEAGKASPADYFTNNTTSVSEVIYSPKLHASPSHTSLVCNHSVLNSTDDNQNPSLTIERIVPLPNKSVIVHWNVKSFHGIQGYEVFVDGLFATKTFSSEHASALIKNMNSKEPHLFAVSIDSMFKMHDHHKKNEAPAVFLHKPTR